MHDGQNDGKLHEIPSCVDVRQQHFEIMQILFFGGGRKMRLPHGVPTDGVLTTFSSPVETEKDSEGINQKMFKKPFSVKSSTKLRSSEAKRFGGKEVLCTRVLATDQLVILYSIDGIPSYFKLETHEDLIPTVQRLLHSNNGQRIVLKQDVYKFILNGADLFHPGIDLNQSDLWTKNQIVGLATSKDAPCFAVGVTQTDSDNGQSGVAAKLIHVFGDTLWSFHPLPNVNIKTFLSSSKDTHMESPSESIPPANTSIENIEESIPDRDVYCSAQDMDALLHQTLLQAVVKTILPTKDKLPLNSSQLWNYMLASRQPNTPELNLKQSSYKKLSAFLTAEAKKGFCKIKTAKSGDVSLIGIEPKHELIDNFIPWKMPAKPVVTKPPEEEINIMELYRANHANTLKILTLLEPIQSILPEIPDVAIKEMLFTSAQITKLLFAFAHKFELINPEDKSEIWPHKQDDLHSLLKGVTSVKRDELVSLFLEKLFRHYSVVLPGHETVIRRGEWKAITLTVERRGGNAYLTTITNLGDYLPPTTSLESVRQDLAKYVAAAVSVDEMDLHVQGTPMKELYTFFHTRFKVPITQQRTSKYITIIDKYNVTKKK